MPPRPRMGRQKTNQPQSQSEFAAGRCVRCVGLPIHSCMRDAFAEPLP